MMIGTIAGGMFIGAIAGAVSLYQGASLFAAIGLYSGVGAASVLGLLALCHLAGTIRATFGNRSGSTTSADRDAMIAEWGLPHPEKGKPFRPFHPAWDGANPEEDEFRYGRTGTGR